MENITVHASRGLRGTIDIPGDKSISHRSVMFGSIAEGRTVITNFLESEDCISTADCFREMGVKITRIGEKVEIKGAGLHGLKAPSRILDAGNSGTTLRLMMGILAGQPFTSRITGDASLQRRPMLRVVAPLREMGVMVEGKENGNFCPLAITGGKLKPLDFVSNVASAQAKSCILLAGLYADGVTSVKEPAKSRDHTERMLAEFGVKLREVKGKISIRGGQALKGCAITVPGDISSAAFFLIAGALVPNSEITVKNVGINPTRTGVLEVLKQMGAKLVIKKRKGRGEPSADITVRSSKLKGVTVKGSIIPRLIDEIPILAVAAAMAKGKMVFKNIGELRVKESDRIKTVCSELSKFGVKTKEMKDSMIIYGNSKPKGALTLSHGDHRVAMLAAVLGLVAEGETRVYDTACIKTSFPEFENLLGKLQVRHAGNY
ncbi:MAG: 3-phosphoshikimate 1-carboxyvinyltransferase [Candidatus Firestonebacteria bacterium]